MNFLLGFLAGVFFRSVTPPGGGGVRPEVPLPGGWVPQAPLGPAEGPVKENLSLFSS